MSRKSKKLTSVRIVGDKYRLYVTPRGAFVQCPNNHGTKWENLFKEPYTLETLKQIKRKRHKAIISAKLIRDVHHCKFCGYNFVTKKYEEGKFPFLRRE